MSITVKDDLIKIREQKWAQYCASAHWQPHVNEAFAVNVLRETFTETAFVLINGQYVRNPFTRTD